MGRELAVLVVDHREFRALLDGRRYQVIYHIVGIANASIFIEFFVTPMLVESIEEGSKSTAYLCCAPD